MPKRLRPNIDSDFNTLAPDGAIFSTVTLLSSNLPSFLMLYSHTTTELASSSRSFIIRRSKTLRLFSLQ